MIRAKGTLERQRKLDRFTERPLMASPRPTWETFAPQRFVDGETHSPPRPTGSNAIAARFGPIPGCVEGNRPFPPDTDRRGLRSSNLRWPPGADRTWCATPPAVSASWRRNRTARHAEFAGLQRRRTCCAFALGLPRQVTRLVCMEQAWQHGIAFSAELLGNARPIQAVDGHIG